VGLYPEIEPYRSGMLEVGDGNRVYWEECGNPAGKPAVALHGGPGSGCTPGWRRYFDPARYRIVLFDQRGCGRSTPSAADPATDLSANTTRHLLDDLELLRRHRGVERWLVFGGSWGSVLGLVYAQRYPSRVSELVLFGVATGRRSEVELLTRGVGRLFPSAWQRFRAGLPAAGLAGSYRRLLADPSPRVRAEAAQRWCDWEDGMVPTSPPSPRFADPGYRMTFARLVTHYWAHDHFLADGEVLRNAHRLSGIPGVIVQGSLDLGNLLGTPWELAHAWPGCELVIVDEAGHGSSDPAMVDALVAATDRFA
jgi:proline iminopeptidase